MSEDVELDDKNSTGSIYRWSGDGLLQLTLKAPFAANTIVLICASGLIAQISNELMEVAS